MMRNRLWIGSAALLLAGAGNGTDTGNPAYRLFEQPGLMQGRVIWLQNCEGCHGYGIAGAPIPMEADAWAPRLKQARETLHQHAIDGFYGVDDTVMPARGGNPNLTDDEVRLAVDYMATLALSYIEPEENTE